MVIVNLDTNLLEGCKVLRTVPKYLEKVRFNGVTKIVEMGTLSSYKKFMAKYKDFDKCKYKSSMKKSSDGWSGSKTYDDFLDVLENGDENVMKKIKIATGKQIAELGKKYEETFIAYKFDVVGQFFDVGLVVTGVPESWLEPEIHEEAKVRVELVINGTFSAGVNEKKIVEGASKILAMAKILEDHDVQVKIKIVSLVSDFSRKVNDIAVATNIKDYDEPINYKKCSALLSPTYLRRGVFKLMELVGGKGLLIGYGHPKNNVKGFIDLMDDVAIMKLEEKLFKKDK